MSSALPLGVIHGQVSAFQRTVELAGGHHADADADAAAGFDFHLLGQCPSQVLGIAGRCVRQQGGELVATDAGEHIREAQPPGDRVGDAFEVVISGRMTALVVDLLEAVKIDHEHRGLILVTVASRQLLITGKFLLESAAVEHAGQSVQGCLPSEHLLVTPTSGDVLDVSYEVARLTSIVAHDGGRELDPNEAPVRSEIALVHLITGDLAVEQPGRLMYVGVEVVRMGDVLKRQLGQLLLFVSR